ncbi:MAG: hypothetical protein ABIQ16_10430 [Polyangiaceae bacterium]
MARQPFRGLLKAAARPRDLATRSLGLAANALAYAKLVKEGKVPGPLLLTLRAANDMARRILEQPAPTPTPTQRLTLLAAGAQLRAMAARVIVSSDARDPNSTEAELAQLLQRTLTLIDRVTAQSPALQTNSDTRRVIDVEAWTAPPLPPEKTKP